MANQFEHLQLPKTDIQLTRRSPRGFSSGKRTNRSSHGTKLLKQVSGILDRPSKEYTPFGINPKLIFKIKLAEEYNLTDDQVTKSGLNLLAKESKKNNAIIVFPDDNELAIFQERLKSYSGIKEDSPEYAYLDAIEALIPLEPKDRIARLLELIDKLKQLNQINFPKMGLLASLYVSQYIPLMFFYEALPVYMRQQGSSLQTIALVNLLILPVVFKFLWSPLIDRYGFTRWGHYRFWIVLFQLIVSLLTVVCAFIDISQNLNLLLIIGFVMCVFCTSQDIAADAMAVNLLTPAERGLGNGIQVSGHYLGAVIGSGGMLILLDKIGWQRTMLLITLIMLVSLLPILLHQEPVKVKPTGKAPPIWRDLGEFFGRRELWLWLLILATYTTGSSMAITMFRPLLVDLGLSATQIGLLLGVVSYGVGTLGALAGGLTVNFLDRKRLLIVGGCFQTIVISAFLLPAWGFSSLVILYTLGILFHGMFGFAETSASTIKMDYCDPNCAGRDFTIQTSLVFFSSAIAGSVSGTITEIIGYSGLFILSTVLILFNLVLISKLKI